SIPVAVKVEPGSTTDTLTLDLTQTTVPLGRYGLEATWDWTRMRVAGDVVVGEFADLSSTIIPPPSQDRLIAGSGQVKIDLAGVASGFVTHGPRGRGVGPTPPVALSLRAPAASNPASPAQVTIDTRPLYRGPYFLTLTQLNGVSQAVPVAVHPALPTLA